MTELKCDAIQYFLENGDVLIHQCNMQMTNAKGTSNGIAGQLIKQFPIISKMENMRASAIKFGGVLITAVDKNKYVINLYSQYYTGSSTERQFAYTEFDESIIMNPEIYLYQYSKNSKDLCPDNEHNRIIALKHSLEVVKKSFNSFRIVAPKIACGLARPKNISEAEYWNNRIKPLFQEINFKNLTVCSL